MLACTTGNLELVKVLLSNPTVKINEPDSSGINAVYVSTYYGHLDILIMLLGQGGKFTTT